MKLLCGFVLLAALFLAVIYFRRHEYELKTISKTEQLLHAKLNTISEEPLLDVHNSATKPQEENRFDQDFSDALECLRARLWTDLGSICSRSNAIWSYCYRLGGMRRAKETVIQWTNVTLNFDTSPELLPHDFRKGLLLKGSFTVDAEAQRDGLDGAWTTFVPPHFATGTFNVLTNGQIYYRWHITPPGFLTHGLYHHEAEPWY